ncbi:MAG: DUF4340 domain-containing protein [Candidatus Krumholzibacteriia bacterium]
MIRQRNLLLLGGLLAVLVLVSVLQQVAHRRAVSHPAQSLLTPGPLAKDELTRIALGQGTDSTAVVLDRLPDKWVVRTAYGQPASQQKVDELIKNLSELRGEFRSKSADVLADYGLDDAQAVRVAVFGKDFKPVLRLLIGKKPAGAAGDFVRRPGNDSVYLTGASLLTGMGLWSGPAKPQSRNFLELQAYETPRDDVDAIVLDDGGKLTELVKEFPASARPAVAAAGDSAKAAGPDRSVYEWRMVKPKAKPVLRTKADGVLNAVVLIRAADVADPDGSLMDYGLWKAARKATLRFRNGKEFTLFFGATRPAQGDAPAGVYMRTDAGNTIWIVRESLVNAIFPKPEELLAAK